MPWKESNMRKRNTWMVELGLGMVLAGCGAAAPGTTASGQGGSGGDTPDGGTVVSAGTAYFPLRLGIAWTYRVTDTSGASADKMTTVEALEPGDGMNGPLAFRFRNESLAGATVNWQQLSGTAIVRYRQHVLDAAGNDTLEKTYAPSSVVFDESEGHLVAGATWNEMYAETKPNATGQPKTTQELVKWTVEATDDVVTVPAGVFTCIRVRRHHISSANPVDEVTWFAPGTGSVKETGAGPLADQMRELVSATLP
jgi:hypothetical protein